MEAEDTVSVVLADAEAAAVDVAAVEAAAVEAAAVDAEEEEVDPHPASVINASIVINVFFIFVQSPLWFSVALR